MARYFTAAFSERLSWFTRGAELSPEFWHEFAMPQRAARDLGDTARDVSGCQLHNPARPPLRSGARPVPDGHQTRYDAVVTRATMAKCVAYYMLFCRCQLQSSRPVRR